MTMHVKIYTKPFPIILQSTKSEGKLQEKWDDKYVEIPNKFLHALKIYLESLIVVQSKNV